MMLSIRSVIGGPRRGNLLFRREVSGNQRPDVSRADGDYGTRFLAAAGVLNLLAALHAYERRGTESVSAAIGFSLTHLQAMLSFALLIRLRSAS